MSRSVSPPLLARLKGKQNKALREQNRKLSNQVRDLTIQIEDIAEKHDELLDANEQILEDWRREKKKCEHWYDFFITNKDRASKWAIEESAKASKGKWKRGGKTRKKRRRRRHKKGKDFDKALKRVIAQHRRAQIARGDKRFKATKGLVKWSRPNKTKRKNRIYYITKKQYRKRKTRKN